ncbi:chitin synthase chs-2-like [Clavelina lepadiformis]|uniref:chitin synthase chs-2-like n=1 Tax=Clavelina lepadiformis TaxID=159417 RepID=UPI004042AD91
MARKTSHEIKYESITNLDAVLETQQLRRSSSPDDGNCFFHALESQLESVGIHFTHGSIRNSCVTYLRRNKYIGKNIWKNNIKTGENVDQYLDRNATDGEYPDEIILQAAAFSLGYSITVITPTGNFTVFPGGNQKGNLFVGRVGENASEYRYIVVKKYNEEKEQSTRTRSENNEESQETDQPPKAQHGILKPATPTMSQQTFPYNNTASNGKDTEGLRAEERPLIVPYGDDALKDPESDELEEWDRYITEPREDESRTAGVTLKFFQKLFKLMSYFIFGGLVVTGAIISKACLMILVNSAKPFIAKTVTSEANKIDHDVIRAWSYIIILIMLLTPEVMTMVYSLYRIVMKEKKTCEWRTLLWGGLWEFLHAIGEGILVLKVLPYIDATVAFLMMPLIGIVPILINIHRRVRSVLSNKKKNDVPSIVYNRRKNLALAVIAAILQIIGLVFCFVCFFSDNWFRFFKTSYTFLWAIAGIVLTSIRYWENFISENIKITKSFRISWRKLHENLDDCRFFSSFVFSLIKCLVLVGMTFLTLVVLENKSYTSNYVIKNGLAGNDAENVPFSSVRYNKILSLLGYLSNGTSAKYVIIQQLWAVFAVQISCSFAAFFFGRVSCLTQIQRESFTFPLMLVTPFLASISAALGTYKQRAPEQEYSLLLLLGLSRRYKGIKLLNEYIDWNNVLFRDTPMDCTTYMIGIVLVGLILGWGALNLITTHLWFPPKTRLERMEVLFVKALYGGVLIDQVLLLNRRQFETQYSKSQKRKEEQEKKDQIRKEKEKGIERSHSGSGSRRRSRRYTMNIRKKFIPQVFLCATMWHETEQEMTQILTSIMRLDKDNARRKKDAASDPDYYNFQAHVMFDDAFEKNEDKETVVNKFVRQLVDLVSVAANKVDLRKDDQISDPIVYNTPYGGRLEIVLPNGNMMLVHLKNKNKIRHRKRWSQCMYMYYILGYLQATQKKFKLEDMFILALDGDVDFQPSAVLLLLDRMKRNPAVGAACGRIHPTGSGPVVWFQKFEYAVGHWLQKTAEHVLGCVLCSPGCFSLFRGEALVDTNVVKRYTTKATEALHYVQWDQGEDRWLCTLLLKQGWRIEYSAASDSFTFAPEDFKEFYNQRRRWGPSTMANIFDILLDASLAVKNNMYISWGYIAYQLGLMISSVLGPATVVMIVQGAYQYVFKWSATVSLVVSLIPVVIFIILCYVTSQDTQVAVAAILTILYALVMTAVIVGVIGSMVNSVLFDPNNIFMILLVGLYGLTGILHPQEVMCLLHGILYYLCVPSAFIFLMVYSLTNMNNVSWGTREVKKVETNSDEANQNALEDVANKKRGRNIQVGGTVYDAPKTADGYYSCGAGYICQCAFCIQPEAAYETVPQTEPSTRTVQRQPTLRKRRKSANNEQQSARFRKFSEAKANQLGLEGNAKQQYRKKLEKDLSHRMSITHLQSIRNKTGLNDLTTDHVRKFSVRYRKQSRAIAEQLAEELDETKNSDVDNEEEESTNPERKQEEQEEKVAWMLDGSLQDGTVHYLDEDEHKFWERFIERYLKPLDENPKEKKRIAADLKSLRNRMTGAYYLANALWLILNFALQLTITDIAIVFYFGATKIEVNPVQFAFLIFFLVILFIQFFCMLVHRWSTALHLLATTSLKWNDLRDGMENTANKDIEKNELERKRKQQRQQNGHAGKQFSDLESARETTSTGNYGMSNPAYSDIEESDSIDTADEDPSIYPDENPEYESIDNYNYGKRRNHSSLLDIEETPLEENAYATQMITMNDLDREPGLASSGSAAKPSAFTSALHKHSQKQKEHEVQVHTPPPTEESSINHQASVRFVSSTDENDHEPSSTIF